MKIAYISGAYIPSRGANSMHAMRMCQAMARNGHEVALHARPGDCDTEDDFQFYGVEPCFRLVKTPRPQVRVWGALVSALRTKRLVNSGPRPDLIYAREFWALVLLRGCGVPFVFESHWKPKNKLRRLAEAAIMRHENCRRVVLISEALRQVYSDEIPWISPERVLVAHDGADPVTAPVAKGAPLGRAGTLQVGYVGSFQTGSGIDLILRVGARIPEADFHVFGGEDHQLRLLMQSVRGVQNVYLHGFREPSELPKLYAGLDVVLAPYQGSTASIEWCSPMKLFEYMAHGKAIICSDFPVMREIIRDDDEGLLVPAARLDEWVRAIRELMNHARRERLGHNARVRLERDFTWDLRARRVLKGLL